MKQNRFALGITAAAVLLLFGLAAELFLPALMGSGDPHMPVPEEFAQQITVHENGDFTYSYTLDDVEIDREAGKLYVSGLTNLCPERILPRSEKQKLAKQADGTVVSDVCGDLNLVQLYVETKGYSELEQAAQKLRQADGVLDVYCETPAFVTSNSVTPATEPDTNPWAAGGTAPDEANPSGSNWGAEAIGAYTAWQYEQWCHDITVGIIDSGFCLDHEDLGGNTTIQMLPGYEANTVSDHGAAVAGIIAAADNDIGLRGIASGPYHQLSVYCMDWNPQGDSGVTLLGTSQLFEAVKCMVQQGVQVLNCSFGIYDVSYNAFRADKFEDAEDKKYEGYSLQELADSTAQAIYDSTRASLIMTMQLILAEKQFLIVQSAGNGVDNGGAPGLSTTTGYFAGITQEFYQQMYPDGHPSVDYTEVDHRILIVGAVENKRTEDGNYIMTSYSCYGPEVDLCAPGDELYTTGADRSAYNENFYGTSAAAPMVTGAAALLWSMDPDLTAREVWDLLVNNNEVMAEGTKNNGHPFMGSEGTYPMLNIGAAVRALMEEKNEKLITEIRITDMETGEPVEGAAVIYCHGFFDGVQSEVSDSDGHCTIRGADDLRPYPAETTVLVKAEGQLRWCGTVHAWLEEDTAQTVNEIELDMNNVLDMTGDLLEQLEQDLPALWEYIQTVMDQVEPAAGPDFSDTLAQLAGQYGVIPLGEEVYPEVTGYGGGEELVDPAR
ncbi:MAG: S8/S53 family peptidase, partial [Oscillospiraceae bacterium]|nr:S8/S53 family peptidase [Oscillospiraceae bacterium]